MIKPCGPLNRTLVHDTFPNQVTVHIFLSFFFCFGPNKINKPKIQCLCQMAMCRRMWLAATPRTSQVRRIYFWGSRAFCSDLYVCSAKVPYLITFLAPLRVCLPVLLRFSPPVLSILLLLFSFPFSLISPLVQVGMLLQFSLNVLLLAGDLGTVYFILMPAKSLA